MHQLSSEAGPEVRKEIGIEHTIQQASKVRPDAVIMFAEPTCPSCVRLIGSILKEIPQAGVLSLGREAAMPNVRLLLGVGALGCSYAPPFESCTARFVPLPAVGDLFDPNLRGERCLNAESERIA
jgi:hypothetical protein